MAQSAPPPRTWLLTSPHTGDNTQLLALAEALGWPFEVKRFVYKPFQTLSRLVLGATLAGVDRARSSRIVPPYPELIIGAGRPNEAVALWLRRNGSREARLVYLGTPWASLERFDLVITTPQYRLPARPNVLHNALPLHGVEPVRMAAESALWQERFAHLPRPWTALLVGGSSGSYTFDAAAGARLGRQASAHAAAHGGALLVTTSARTAPAAAAALAQHISVPSYVFRWTSQGEANPFLAFLALADRFIVTADSISMIAEACATGRPVMLFDTEEDRQSMRAEEGIAARAGRLPPPYWRGRDLNTTFFRLAVRFGPPRWSRDPRIVHRQLLDAGRVAWLGDPPTTARPAQPDRDMDRAVARIRALFAA